MIGSLRRDSYNKQLAEALLRLAPGELTFHRVRIDDLPPYNQDDDPNSAGGDAAESGDCSGRLLFVTPEYNRSIPGVLKNAIDHASRPYGKSAWTAKPAGVIGDHRRPGHCMAQQHLRNVLAYLDVPTLGQPEAFIHVKEGFFDPEGNVADSGTREFLRGWINSYAEWVKSFVKP